MHDDRVTITIPFPSYIPRARGVHAAGKFGTTLKSRCTLEEKQAVQKAIETIGVSEADFIRWCCSYVAKEVLKGVDVQQRVAV